MLPRQKVNYHLRTLEAHGLVEPAGDRHRPGIACWFVPAEVDERVGGEIVIDHGPGADSRGVVTAWEPPHRFAYEEHEWAEGAPPWATQMLVEARAGGTCLVRLISGIHSGGEEWGDEIDGTEAGWAAALELLRLYLTHFAGERCTHALAVGEGPWSALGLGRAREGERVDGPLLAGVVERTLDEMMVVRDTDGFVEAYAHGTRLIVRGYRFGERGAERAAREQRAWRAWMDEHAAAAA
jgi:hypothetical protein